MKVKEQVLDAEIKQELKDFNTIGSKLLKLKPSMDPDDVMKVIRDYINTLIEGGQKVEDDRILPLAVVWGNQICQKLKWEWVELLTKEESDYAIVSPQREYAAYPLSFMKELLTEPERDNTSLLFYNMVKANKFSPAKPGDYYSIG